MAQPARRDTCQTRGDNPMGRILLGKRDAGPISALLRSGKKGPRPPSMPQALSVMGVSVVPFESYVQAVQCVAEALASGQPSFWVAVNPEKVYRARHDPQARALLNQADAGICDGIGVAVAAWVLLGRRIQRCTGVDLFFELMAAAQRRGWRVFLLGASPEANAAACQRLLDRYPGLQIVGCQDGYFKDSPAVVRHINEARPDLLFVAMGSPKQEFWIARHRADLNAGFCLGVGGTFDIASGRVRRAPWVFRRIGLEFLCRFLADPRRWRREISRYLFLLTVLKVRLLGDASRAERWRHQHARSRRSR